MENLFIFTEREFEIISQRLNKTNAAKPNSKEVKALARAVEQYQKRQRLVSMFH